MRDEPVPAADPRAGLTSLRRYTWWTLVGTTEFFLILLVGRWLLRPDVPVAVRACGGVALPVVVVVSAVLLTRRLDRPPIPGAQDGGTPVGWLAAGCGAAVLLGAILLAGGEFGLWALAPATMASVTATFLPAGRRWWLIAVAAAGAALPGGVTSALSGGDVLYAAAFPAGLVAFVAWLTLGMMWSWDVTERLNEARRLSAELAVKDERLRFAADLHDIQGHHLQVIALKSELAARLAQADPARAAAEMEEVRRLAADALRDTRAVVQGYRRTSLDSEIVNATRVLAAAGIDASTQVEPAGVRALPDGGGHLLGLVMREATTNVLRHSHARHAEVDFRVSDGFARLRVGNDGADATPDTGTGTGLRTLAERLRAAGGGLTWEHEDDRFVVAARLPVGAPAAGTEAR
ncbi:sensor histidine kinase [Nonomuraea sp. NPDC049480]|uniref:sensor histidine kinase n=1 Tax=Nonomuraea sp. NPDC049480 TaxID=3364353 RepID=UPI0037BD319F